MTRYLVGAAAALAVVQAVRTYRKWGRIDDERSAGPSNIWSENR